MPQQKKLALNTKPFRCLVVRCWLLVARRAFMPGTHPCLNPSQALVCRGRPVKFPDDGNDAAQVAQGAPVVRPWLKRGGLPAPAVGARGGPRGGHAGAHPVEGEAGQVLPAAALHRRARRNRGLAEHPGRLQVLHRIPSPVSAPHKENNDEKEQGSGAYNRESGAMEKVVGSARRDLPCHNSMGRPEPSRVRVRRSEGLWNRQIFLQREALPSRSTEHVSI